jgi:Arc/MetJ-type ribon-helix-helix transcriptional regulator
LAEVFALAEQGVEVKDYEEIVVKLAVSKDYLRKLEQLIDVKRIFSSRAEAFRRSLELLFDKYQDSLKENQ